MEGRKLKRYDSAPLPAGATAAPRGAAVHVSNIPRSYVAQPGSLPTPPTATQPASAAASAPAATTSYEKQLVDYYTCMEEDNKNLLKFYDAHTSDIAALRVLVQERKYKDAIFTAMEAKTASIDAFLKELMDLTGTTRGLRARRDANSAKSAAGKSSPAARPEAIVSMDEVRDAVQKQQHALAAARRNEERQKLVIQALEKEVAALKCTGQCAAARSETQKCALTESNDATADEDCCLPGTAKELRDAQRTIRELKRQLTKAACDAKDSAATVKKLQQQCTVHLQALQCRDEELAGLRSTLDCKERLITALEAKVHKQKSTSEAHQGASKPGPRDSRTNSAPVTADHHSSSGETSTDRLIVTHHYRLLGGQAFVDGHCFSPESFKDAFLRSVSTLLRVPYGYLTSVEVRTHTEAVSVEFDVRHPARVKEDEIDFSLLSHDYPELRTFLDKAKAELATRKPPDRNAKRIKELEAALAERVGEVDSLRRAMRSLEASLSRRDADRETLDTDMDNALRETEATVKEVYEALQSTQQEAQELQKALAMKSTQLRVSERAKAAVQDAAAAAEKKFKTELAALHEQLATAQAAVDQAREEATRTLLQRQADEKVELLMSTFRFSVALPTESAQCAANRLLEEAQQTRVLHALLLCHAARCAGAVPVVTKECSLGDGAATLEVAVNLAFYAGKKDAEAVKVEMTKKLSSDPCNVALEYLRMCSDAFKREAATVLDAQRAVREAEQRVTTAISASQAEMQQAQNTQRAAEAWKLREIHARVSSVLPGGSADASSVLERIGQLVSRLTAAESAARRLEEESRRATQLSADAQQERERLEHALSGLTARCTELSVAKEQLAERVGTLEAQLRNQQTSSGDSGGALEEKLKRLEATLSAKTAAAESERNRMLEEHRTASIFAAARLAEVEEALAMKEVALAELQSKMASSGPGVDSGASAEEAALREALRLAKEERTALARQVREMDTDMSDLSNIQASMQRELEAAQQELRAKKHDFDLLVKQLIRMEEREKRRAAEQHSVPVSPRRQNEDAERDDVARESLVVLTNSNTTLQQCLRRLQCVVTSMGMEASLSPGSAADRAGAAGGCGSETDSGRAVDDNSGTRRSGHRKSALGTTVSRAATDHRKLLAQLADLLLPLLDKLDIPASRETASKSFHCCGTTAAAMADAATASPSVKIQACTVKHPPRSAPFSRTASASAAMGAETSGHASTANFAVAREAANASYGNTPKRGTASDTALGVAVSSSGGKTTVDAAPRLDFSRQTSSRTYIRSNTSTSAAASTGGAGLPPAAAAAGTGDSPSSGGRINSSGAAIRGSGGERKEEKSNEQPKCGVSSSGGALAASAAGNSASPTNAPSGARRSAAPTSTAKATALRRSNTTATFSGGRGSNSAIEASLMRTACGHRGLPTMSTAATDSSGSFASHMKRARATHM
ncbi:hypothetical protein LSCM1_04723 [Leishmania martiniquensis]|uniref:Flagellar attachment zone protein 1 conserved domain-containing protein n=1 Tax=Leishmania martiniquensis TaxID=1580590 RepID=A0A836H8D5_9TRYP|nr:hypothetical protein LSCM1_04723 [Leishmania martiniquensis]